MPRDADPAVLAGPAPEVAPLLLGAMLTHDGVAVRLTEVEAYAGARDPGSHAYRGRTRRNEVMFGPAGRLYTYLSYGVHVCANVVTGPEGEAGAVLLRAGEVLTETDEALTPARRRDLARGPGRLCRTLGIGLAHDGSDLRTGEVGLRLGPPPDPATVRSGPRVGLRLAAEVPWRFWLAGEPTVSPYRPARPRT